ncbi:Transmembrane protein 53 [Gracilariopsis chorda]|uniref:Transmembrane protein 53 n=1 Tax=Gracilariopsis chorda TaxID=448386 RepID=A0A2V3J2C1_9FLOR|nr:Transmembrane protein 53 [Gracilariopsis chorda]|eukprot:PXF48601.1 Transmembrane protein 53 [Gracilariopsis chorda]
MVSPSAFVSLPLVAAGSCTRTIVPQASSLPPHAQGALNEGRRRARALMYGGGGAFRGLATRRQQLERQLQRMGSGGFGRFGGLGGGGGSGDDHHHHDDDDNVDPSWGVAPGAHVIMRGRADDAYRIAVANLIAMGASLAPPSFVDQSVPVVIILSWMGAQKKHLKKYTKFYEDLGYEVHCVCNDLKTAIFPPASKAQAKRIGDIIDQQPPNRPVFVHAFSIGTGIYGLLLDGLRHEKERFDKITHKIAGVVFDSGPAPIFPNDVAKGLHTVCPMISKAVWEPIASTFFWITKARHSFGRSEDALRTMQLPSPQLYFYSGDDKVIPNMKNAVEGFMENNRQRGLEVYNKFWEKSVHASHLKIHPDEYIANLSSFINRCMEIRSIKDGAAESSRGKALAAGGA